MASEWNIVSELEKGAILDWISSNYDFVLQEISDAGENPPSEVEEIAATYINLYGLAYIREIMKELTN